VEDTSDDILKEGENRSEDRKGGVEEGEQDGEDALEEFSDGFRERHFDSSRCAD
jgi:hypothetical protein